MTAKYINIKIFFYCKISKNNLVDERLDMLN